jgi:hypothetical protein
MDVDNNPDALVRPANSRLLSVDGLLSIRAALRPGGEVLAVWSARPAPAFENPSISLGSYLPRSARTAGSPHAPCGLPRSPKSPCRRLKKMQGESLYARSAPTAARRTAVHRHRLPRRRPQDLHSKSAVGKAPLFGSINPVASRISCERVGQEAPPLPRRPRAKLDRPAALTLARLPRLPLVR